MRFNCTQMEVRKARSKLEVSGQTDLHWAPVALCQTCGSVDGAWLCLGTARLHPLALGDQRSAAAPPCSMSETEAPPMRPLMTVLSPPATRGSSGGLWTSWQQKRVQHKKRSHYPEIGGEEERVKDTEREELLQQERENMIRHEYECIFKAAWRRPDAQRSQQQVSLKSMSILP